EGWRLGGRVAPLERREEIAVELVDAVLDLADDELRDLLVALEERGLAAHGGRDGVAIAIVGEGHGRADDRREDDRENQRETCALPRHGGWLSMAQEGPCPKSNATSSCAP